MQRARYARRDIQRLAVPRPHRRCAEIVPQDMEVQVLVELLVVRHVQVAHTRRQQAIQHARHVHRTTRDVADRQRARAMRAMAAPIAA